MNESENFSWTPWQSATDPTLRITAMGDCVCSISKDTFCSIINCWDKKRGKPVNHPLFNQCLPEMDCSWENSLPCVIKLSSAPCVVLHIHSRKFLITEFPLNGFICQKRTLKAPSLGPSFIRRRHRVDCFVFNLYRCYGDTAGTELEYVAL